MKLRTLSYVLSVAMAVPTIGFVVGCDKELAHDETTKTKSDGTQTHSETDVKQKSDGTVVKTQEKDVNKPANPNP